MKYDNFLILFLFFSLFSCKVQKKNKPLLTQIESNQPIILHINPEVKNFWMVENWESVLLCLLSGNECNV